MNKKSLNNVISSKIKLTKTDLHQYILLQFLLINGIEIFIEVHGNRMLNVITCNKAKKISGCGSLADSEKEIIKHLNKVIQNKHACSYHYLSDVAQCDRALNLLWQKANI